jgi:hypothetical protein
LEDAKGPCDAGDKCFDGTCRADQFKDISAVCRPAVDCCDEPDTCTSTSYDCSDDEKYGSDVTCRTSCNDSPFDPAETCKNSDSCPPNVILKEETCLTAGQNYDAGTMSVSVTETAEDTWTMCYSVSLGADWTLKGDESIKAHFSVDNAPGSAPGQYDYKYPNGGISYSAITDTYGACLDVTDMICPSNTLFFAVHLDVKNSVTGQTETAWAMNDCASGPMTTLPSSQFLNTKGKAQGWGTYFMWQATCPNDDTCLDATCIGKDFPPAPTPTHPPTAMAPPTDPPSAADSCDVTCTVGGTTTTTKGLCAFDVSTMPVCDASLASAKVNKKKKKKNKGKKNKGNLRV